MHAVKKGFYIPGINKLGFVGLVSSIGFAAIATIWAVFLESLLKNPSYVGFLTSFFMIVGGLAFLYLTPIIERQNKSRLYAISIIVYILSYILFALFPTIYVVVILGTLLAVIASLRVMAFGIIVRDKSRDKSVAKNEGLIYTTMNLAWLLGPLIAGFIVSKYQEQGVFLFAAIAMMLSFFLFFVFKIKDNRTTKKIDRFPLKIFIEFFRNKERRLSYIVSGGVNFWWSLIYIYIPIYIILSGLDEFYVGIFLSAVVVPLVLTNYYFGRLAGRIGFKKIFMMGYSILGIMAFLCFFSQNIYLTLGMLALASFGAAMVEPTTEAYFFDVINKEQRDKFYGAYNTTIDVNAFIARLLPAVILLFLPFNFIFLVFALFMFIFVLFSTKVRNIIENKKG